MTVTPSGCRRSSGWPGETRSPSSTSHSMIVPPYGAVTGVSSRGPDGRRSRRRGRAAALAQVGGWRKVPLAGATSIRQVGAGVDLARRRRACHERAGVVELVGGLEREGLDALHGALGDPGQGAGRRHLEQAGDAEVEHRLHAEVPADRAADLGDDPLEHLAAVVDDLAVAVGDQRGPRVVGGHRPGQRCRAPRRPGPCARCGTRRRRDSGISRALAGGVVGEGGELLDGAGGDDLAGAVVVGRGQAVLASAASTSSRSPPRTAVMLVGVVRGGRGHRVAALADQHHRLLGGDRPGAGGRGELADAVAGDGADLARTRRPGAGTARGRPAGRRRPAAAGRRRCPGSCRRRPRCRSATRSRPATADSQVRRSAKRRDLEPGRQEAGGLGALAGSDDGEHTSTLPRRGAGPRARRSRRFRALLCRNPTRSGLQRCGCRRAGRQPPQRQRDPEV